MKNLRYVFVETTLMAAAILGAANLASASSPAAWAQHDKDVAAACHKASGLRDPQVQPAVVRFDDAIGLDARLVRGTWPQAHMQGQRALMLCLFDRKSRKATAQHADDWAGTLPAR
jgi:hypothetical protein